MSIAARQRAEDYFALEKFAERVLIGYERAVERFLERTGTGLTRNRWAGSR